MNSGGTPFAFLNRFPQAALWGAVGLFVLAALVFIARTFVPSLTQMTHSFPAYYTAARLVLDGEWDVRVYDDAWFGERVLELTDGRMSERFSMNPPTTALILLPLAWLDLTRARIVWQLLNLALLLATLWLLASSLRVPVSVGSILFGAFVFVFPPLLENFRVGQVYVLLLFMFALVLWSETHGRAYLGGVALGVALSFKPGGIPLLLLLIVRQRWRAVLAALGMTIALAAASFGVFGTAGWFAFVRRASEYTTAPLAAHVAYQSVPNFFQHLLARSTEFNPTPLLDAPSLAPMLTLIISVTTLGWTLWLARRAELALAFGAVTTLSVLLSPLASEYHYTLLLLPLAVMAAQLATSHTRIDLVWFAAILLLLCVPINWNAPRWNDPAWALFAYPRLYGGWLLWFWLVRRLNLEPHQASVHS